MKLLLTITVAEYRKKLEEFFNKQNITSYNEFEVTGVNKPEKAPHRVGNWFGNNEASNNNIAFFTMVQNEQAENILIDLNNCKKEMPNCNIQAYVLNIENAL